MGSQFPGFLGNVRAVRLLAGAIDRNELAHAYLLAGPPGSGKKALARAAAGRVFCRDSCGRCSHCQLLAKGVHPDYQVFSAAGLIKLEHARELKRFLQLAPASASHRVAVLENSHHMSSEAANSLLKILEDPPAQSLCFLTAVKVSEVLPTIVSRTQVLLLEPLSVASVKQHLEQRGADPAQAEIIAAYSDGILGRALALVEDEHFFHRRKQWAAVLTELLEGKADPLEASAHWHVEGEQVLEFMVYWFRDMLMLQTVPGHRPANKDLKNLLAASLRRCPPERAVDVLQGCALARERLLANCNSRLVFDSLLLRMWKG